MTGRVLDGRAVARRLQEKTAELARRLPRRPGLAVVLAGEDPGSRIYVRRKGEAAAKLGFEHRQLDLPTTCSLAATMYCDATKSATIRTQPRCSRSHLTS